MRPSPRRAGAAIPFCGCCTAPHTRGRTVVHEVGFVSIECPATVLSRPMLEPVAVSTMVPTSSTMMPSRVEPNVIVRAERENVALDVGPVMRPADRPDMRRLGVRAGRRLDVAVLPHPVQPPLTSPAGSADPARRRRVSRVRGMRGCRRRPIRCAASTRWVDLSCHSPASC
jgi:hypothetical protein